MSFGCKVGRLAKTNSRDVFELNLRESDVYNQTADQSLCGIERYMAEFWCFAEKLVGDIQPGVNALDLLLFVGLYVFECRTLEISMFVTLVRHSEFDIRYNLVRLVVLYR